MHRDSFYKIGPAACAKSADLQPLAYRRKVTGKAIAAPKTPPATMSLG